jgi:hypothetical protein
MVNPFGTDDMAASYATSRPAVHLRVIEKVFQNRPILLTPHHRSKVGHSHIVGHPESLRDNIGRCRRQRNAGRALGATVIHQG